MMEENLFTPCDLSTAAPIDIAKAIVKILDERKAKNITLLHVEENTILSDYFVICSGNSNTQIKGLCDEVEYKLGLCGVVPKGIEGENEASWILMDYYSVIVHIFNRELRDFYKLEKLWANSEPVDISDLLTRD